MFGRALKTWEYRKSSRNRELKSYPQVFKHILGKKQLNGVFVATKPMLATSPTTKKHPENHRSNIDSCWVGYFDQWFTFVGGFFDIGKTFAPVLEPER